MALSLELVQLALTPYGQVIDGEACIKINIYMDLLLFWNRKISLTSITNPRDILRFHFGESIFALQLTDIRHGRLADVGSGAGFPGLAIKIFRPELDVILIEPSMKKSGFLAEVVRSLGLYSVEIIAKPFEQSGIPSRSLQYVTCRALANVSKLLLWSETSLKQAGSVILWVSSEKAVRIQKTSGLRWGPPTIIPGTRHRSILVGHNPD